MNNARADYTDNTLVFKDLSTVGSIYVYFRKRLNEQQLAGLKDIEGITRLNLVEGAYGASMSLDRSPSHYYGAGINCGTAFSFNELAPKIALVVADALDISLDVMDVRSDSMSRGHNREDWIADAARALRKPQPWRNPVFDGAATIEDVVPGVQLLTVDLCSSTYFTTSISEPPYIDRVIGDPARGGYVLRNIVTANFGRLGITQNQAWQNKAVSIVNNPTNRRKLVLWLLERKNKWNDRLATKIVEDYPGDFVMKIIVKDGTLTAEVS